VNCAAISWNKNFYSSWKRLGPQKAP